jgi:hypothetical protein
MGVAWPVNLGALGNSLAIWLGISPWQLVSECAANPVAACLL